ncbi:hypothetical protein [Polaromonas sp.]|uniref:hypothetical protein n=1 Tax=Polaromonas sp. TaxID=1869339 RepID=UPI00352B7D36
MYTFLRAPAPPKQHLSGLRAQQHAPTNKLLILGQAPLMGAITGYLALELSPAGDARGSKLWTLYDHEMGFLPWPSRNGHIKQKTPYARLCADAPTGLGVPLPMTFWVNPLDELTMAAGFGAEWLLPIAGVPRSGLVLAQLNTLMLDADATTVLTGHSLTTQ